MSGLDIAKLIIDAVLALAALMGAVTGICGLRTWRRELRGRAEYRLARRVMRAVLRVREAINALRRLYAPLRLATDLSDGSREREDVTRAALNLNALLSEAEVVCVDALAGPKRGLRGCLGKLKEALSTYDDAVHARRDGLINDARFREMKGSAMTILEPAADPKKDSFGVELHVAVDGFRCALRPHLGG